MGALNLVGLAAVERVVISVLEGLEILRADVFKPHAHGRRDPGDGIEHPEPGIEFSCAVAWIRLDRAVRDLRRRRHEFIATDEQSIHPSRVGTVVTKSLQGRAVVLMVRPAALPTASASLRMRIIRASGAKGLPFTDADRRDLPGDLRVHRLGRLRLHGLVQHLPEGENPKEELALTTRPVPSTKIGLVGLLNAPSRPCPVR